MAFKIAGIDYSMSCPCITVCDTAKGKFQFSNCEVHYLTDTAKYAGTFGNIHGTLFKKPDNQIERFVNIANWAIEIVKTCDQTMLEDYAMGAQGRVFHIAENTAMLKYALWTRKLAYAALAPTKLKKYATGKGNSDKQKMYEAFCIHTKTDLKKTFDSQSKKIGNPISDIVDSFYLAQYLVENPLNTLE